MKHQDIEIESFDAQVSPRERVRIVLRERVGGRWGRVTRVRQVTLPRHELVAALRDAGLYERVEVSRPETTTVEADVAMFAALWTIPNPSQRAKEARQELWSRILRQIGAPTMEAVGARTVLHTVDGITFTVGKPVAGWKCVVKLEQNDTYSVEVGQVVDFVYGPVVQAFDVYAGDLAAAIMAATATAGVMV